MGYKWKQMLHLILLSDDDLEYKNFTRCLIYNRGNIVSLPTLFDSITSIGDYAFADCVNLSLTSLPESLTSIGSRAFSGCGRLALTSLPESLTSIGESSFSSCTDINSLTFKGTPSTIHSTAFNYCENLTTINVPWAEGAVAGAPWGATNATINYNYVEG